MLIDNCRFHHPKPTAGTRDIYIDMVGTTGWGMISNCTFAAASTTVADFMCLKGTVLNSNCYGSDGIIET